MDKIKKFLVSDWFTVILLVASVGIVFGSYEIIGTVAFAASGACKYQLVSSVNPIYNIYLPFVQSV